MYDERIWYRRDIFMMYVLLYIYYILEGSSGALGIEGIKLSLRGDWLLIDVSRMYKTDGCSVTS
jgi:hypothetical protein